MPTRTKVTPRAKRSTNARKPARKTVKKATSRRTVQRTHQKRKLGKEQLAAMVAGRNETKIIDTYMEALGQRKPQGKPPSRARLERLKAELPATHGLKRITQLQAIADTEARFRAAEQVDGYPAAEAAFIEVAAAFSERRGISYATWRNGGVPAATLKKAGIPATRA